MAETNGTLTPPLFREPLVQAGPWTMSDSWQRWLSAFWQQAQTTAGNAPGPGPFQPLDATLTAFAALTGTPNTFAYFTATENMALTGLSAYSRTLLALGDAASWRSTLGLGSGATITASGTATYAAYWSSATTLSSTLAIQVNTTQNTVGFNSYPPPTNVSVRAYHTSLASLRLNAGDDVVARWPLDCPGQGHITQLGVSYGPNVAATDGVNLRVDTARLDLVGISYNPVAGRSLRASSCWFDYVGVGYDINTSYSIRAGNSYFDAAGFGYAGGSGYSIRAGYSAFDQLYNIGELRNDGVIHLRNSVGIGDWAQVGWTLYNHGNGYHAGAATFANTVAMTYLVGIAGAADGRWHFTNWGTSYFAGTTQHAGVVGIGYAPGSVALRAGTTWIDHLGVSETPVGGWYITTYNLLVRANIQTDSLSVLGTFSTGGASTIGGTTRFNNYVGIFYDPDNRFVVRMGGAIYCDGVPYNGGGGPWVAYSDRRMKHNIHAIHSPLETMCALRGVNFEYNDTADGKPAGIRMGVLADEVEEVLPQWVGELSGFKTTQLSQFEALTIEAMKALTARVAALEGAD